MYSTVSISGVSINGEPLLAGKFLSIFVHFNTNEPLLAGKWGMRYVNFRGVIIPIQNDHYKWGGGIDRSYISGYIICIYCISDHM